MKLAEENASIRALGDPATPVYPHWDTISEAAEGQHVGLSDDESIADQSSDADNICGACRTRESKTWWKAPKGLATDILCDTCGINWRKYADLNVRPSREESLPSGKAKPAEKREGTPLAGPSTKRSRVGVCTFSPDCILKCRHPDFGFDAVPTASRTLSGCPDSLFSLSIRWAIGEGGQMSSMPVSCSCW
jgi:hypothetical protein